MFRTSSESISAPPTPPSPMSSLPDGPGRSARRPDCCRPAAGESVRSARRDAAALLPLRPRREGFPGRLDCPALESPNRDIVIGRLAQKRGTENAGRLVSSAKSWLSHAGVDRPAAMLPWKAPEGVKKLSPVDASAQYLRHLREAWNCEDAGRAVRRSGGSGHRSGFLRRGRARAHAESRRAGRLSRTSRCSKSRRPHSTPGSSGIPTGANASQLGDLILVVDIGGGTTDFTLIAVTGTATANWRSNASRSANTSCSAATISISRWPAPSASGSPTKGTQHRRAATAGALAQLPRRERKAARARIESRRSAGHDPGQRHRAGRRHDQSRAAARGSRSGSAKASSRRRRATTCRSAAPRRLAGNRAALCRRCRRHPASGALPAPAVVERGAQFGAARARAGSPAPRTCCSTAACCIPPSCAIACCRF